MKAKKLIESVRNDVQRMYDLYEEYVRTDGASGMNCSNPESLRKKLDRTDAEIVQLAIDKGLWIEDADDYLK